MDRQDCHFCVSLADRVEVVKKLIADREAIRADYQRLIFNKSQPEDGYTLAECNIRFGETLHVALRLRGEAADRVSTWMCRGQMRWWSGDS
jgi:hypothetical protein